MSTSMTSLPERLSIHPEWRGNRIALVASLKPSAAVQDVAAPMDRSPLTQQTRPEVFEAKISALYRGLLTHGLGEEDEEEGFWHEFFLLRPDLAKLEDILTEADPTLLLQRHHTCHQLLSHGISHAKTSNAPANEHALDTLTVFFVTVLGKKYSTPSSDIIEILAGLDHVDAVLTDLVATLEQVIRSGGTVQLRQKAVRTCIAVVSGGYQTIIISYFTNRDFFPAITKLVFETEDAFRASEALLLAGLLANHNKFEVHNLYSVRFADLVNDETMRNILECMASTCTVLRDDYVAILDDRPPGWSIGGTLSYVGLGALAGVKPGVPVLPEEQQIKLFAEQPGHTCASLLALYDFCVANKVFCRNFVTLVPANKTEARPFSIFTSFTSYLYQHSFRSARATAYSYLTLLILLVLTEDTATVKLLCDTSASVRLCRQRPPYLPLVGGDRPYVASILDLLTDCINHNLRRRLDAQLYIYSFTAISQLFSYFAKSRTKVVYHWAELWRSLLSFSRFLTTYPDDLKHLIRISEVVHSLVDLLALALTTGEAFLPDSAAYDDLFYKLVESGEALVKLRETYSISTASEKSSINTLISVSQHYRELIEGQKAKNAVLSPRDVNTIIKQGYETLSLETKEDVEERSRFREVEHKTELKRIVRVIVADATQVVRTCV